MRLVAACFAELLERASRDPKVALIFLRELWPSIAGNELATRCQPVALQGKVLTLQASDATWRAELARSEVKRLLMNGISTLWKKPPVERIEVRLRPS